MIGYKVLEKINDEYRSYNKVYRLKYSLDDWTIPKVGRLYYFNSILNAEYFARKCMNGEEDGSAYIFEAEVEDSIAEEVVLMPYILNECTIEEFWRTTRKRISCHNLFAPQGTYSCSKLKLLKLVRYLEYDQPSIIYE